MSIFQGVCSTFCVLLTASVASAQPAGERGGPPSWMGGFDPSRIFESMDRNRDGVVTRDELTGRRDQERFDDYVRRAGVTDGRLTNELFLKAFQQRMNDAQQRMSERMGGRTFTAFGNPQDLFRNYDRDRNGRLDREEIERTQRLRLEVDRWDGNRDGAIDPDEFDTFMRGLGLPVSANGAGSSDGSAAKPEPEKPTERVHYRAGKLPPNLPEWFTQLDRDEDGQVGLYEWKDRPAQEYFQFDRNGDGFITIEEAEHAAAKPTPQPASERAPVRDGGEG